MAEYIDRDKALDAMQGRIKLSDECLPYFKEYLQGVNDRIKAIPSVDVVERKHGKWENTLQGWKCSACHKEQDYSVFFDFCPNCGARMESEGKDG